MKKTKEIIEILFPTLVIAVLLSGILVCVYQSGYHAGQDHVKNKVLNALLKD